MEIKIIRMNDVVVMVNLSRSTIWRRVKTGDFPAPLRLGGPGSRAKGWRVDDIEKWVDEPSVKQ